MLTVAFDADDTLWHNEGDFADVEDRFRALMARWAEAEVVDDRLVAHERARLETHGYGVKSFTIAMVSAACDISDDRISATDIATIVEWGDELLRAPTRPIDGAFEAMQAVAEHHAVMIVTKGDLHHQLRRIEATDYASLCRDVEVVAEKDVATYQRLFARHRIAADDFVMIGNSVASDVRPVLDAGARAVHVPYPLTWALERAEDPPDDPARWRRVESIHEVPAAVQNAFAGQSDRRSS